ncbi:MAG TPA: c-type cytochrome [Candidatus Sulfotelmatobacter sp.]|nr:c-type cytochrome [Candidatus Sulfotelmatobacter sp.]
MKYKPMLVPTLLIVSSVVSSAADEAAALYKKKCSGCHGRSGEGKPAIKAPAIKGTSRDATQLVEHITKGEATSKSPHNKGIAGLSSDQAQAIAEFVKSLQ